MAFSTDGGAQKGEIDGVRTGEGSKDPGLAPPHEGETNPAVRGTSPVDPLAGTTRFTQTIPRSGGTVGIGAGLTTSMGKWPVSPKGPKDERV